MRVTFLGIGAAVLFGTARFGQAQSPTLTDFWNTKAVWASDSNNIGGSFGFHFISTITNNSEIWAYYINNYYGPTGSIKSATGRARSTDGINWTNDGIVLDVGGVAQKYFQSESLPPADHQVGRADGDGWSAAKTFDATGYLARGPHTQDIPSGTNSALFRLLINKFLAMSNVKAVTLDVYDETASQVLTSRDVFRDDFTSDNAYQNFSLPFTNIAGHSLEFRTYWWDAAYIRQDYVGVIIGAPPYWDDRLCTFPGIWKDGDTWYLVYEGAAEDISFSPGDIGLATSTDGKYFIKHPNNPILRHNTTGWETVNIGTPSLYKEIGIWYLFYHGFSGNFVRIGVATGTSLTNLTKYAGNPIINVAPGTTAWDCGTAGKRSSIVKEGGYYYLAYEGSTRQPYDQAKWSSGLARSTDLFNWTKFAGNPVIPQTTTSFGFDGPELLRISNTWFMYVRTSDGTAPTKRFRLVATPPVIVTPPQNQSVIEGSNATFSVNLKGTPPLSYQWKFSETNIPGATTSTYARIHAQPGDAGNYLVTVTNVAGGVTSSPVTLTVVLPPAAQIDSAQVLPDGRCELKLSGRANFFYAVQASTNLNDWVTLTNIFNQSGTFEFIDLAASNQPYRFYRVR